MRRPSFLWLSPTLTAIGQRLGFDAHYFAKNTVLVTVGQGIGMARGILTGYLVARLFPQEQYGQYQFILSVTSMLASFTLPGMATAVTRAWARRDSFSRATLIRHQLAVCLIGSAILLGCIPFLRFYGREELWPLFVAAAVVFPLSPIAMVHFGGYTVGRARFDLALRVTIVWSIFMIIATLAVLALYPSPVLMLIVTACFPSLVYIYYSRRLRPPAEEGKDRTEEIVRYSWQMSFATLPIELVWYVDKMLISHLFGLGQLATFSVALLIPEQVKMLTKPFLPIGFSKQAEGEDSRERRVQLIKIGLVGTAIFAIGVGIYIALTPWLIPLLFPQYDASEVTLLTNISALTLLAVPGGPFEQYLRAQGMIRQIRISNWISAAVFGIALLVLIPTLGLLGAILARGVFRFLYAGILWWFIVRAPIRGSTILSP